MTDAAVDEPLVLTEDIGPVRRLTMNRPKALNALSHDLIESLSDAFRAAGEDPDVSVIILRGGGRAFCAGLRPDRGRGGRRAGRASLARRPRAFDAGHAGDPWTTPNR
jgi:enoyl-CoA hydratase/carnithine racemase